MPNARDQLHRVDPRLAVQAAYATLSSTQDLSPGLQVAGWAILFQEACEALQLSPGELLDKARRIKADAKAHYSLELAPMYDYIKKELE